MRIFLLLLLLPGFIYAQKIENMASFRDISGERYFRLNYDNDFFTATDRNYTQGYNLEFVHPALQKNPMNHLFLKPKNTENKYGLSIEHLGFTPRNYGSVEIQDGDRPFASAIMLKSFSIKTNSLKKYRLNSSVSLGIIGPAAFGKEMQVGIHEATGNTIPLGWRNQIRNDIIINYELGYEKLLLRSGNLFSLNSTANLKLGTLNTKASLGLNLAIGLINSPFEISDKKDAFKLYFYSQPLINVIGYDASLQGGVFNNSSPYTISSGEIERFTAQNNFGLVLQTSSLYFEYSRSLITREFSTGDSARWGGIRIGFKF
ncbi:lipid A deacylase LpxR family protein [Salegentibacter sp. JZCK2]|uniref:lipid A deacylase LpxR family protein n=1 Tax=Salegentibacter tibetensis TaxID=2873600 RepID=UPI001CCB28F3|nr:lipid A deacylase LpxR family protein [Salegentibacter tibetensis]MBZ9728739.1 lipid A deacylase LpxR family protein [Salegentibacter tibetensis]